MSVLDALAAAPGNEGAHTLMVFHVGWKPASVELARCLSSWSAAVAPVVVRTVDCLLEPDLAARWGVIMHPTVLLLDGRERAITPGPTLPADVRAAIAPHLWRPAA